MPAVLFRPCITWFDVVIELYHRFLVVMFHWKCVAFCTGCCNILFVTSTADVEPLHILRLRSRKQRSLESLLTVNDFVGNDEVVQSHVCGVVSVCGVFVCSGSHIHDAGLGMLANSHALHQTRHRYAQISSILWSRLVTQRIPFSALTLLVWRHEGIRACKNLVVGLLVVTIWLKLCTSYSSSCHHHHLHHP